MMDIWDKIEQERLIKSAEANAIELAAALKRKCQNCGASPARRYKLDYGPMYSGLFCNDCMKKYDKKYYYQRDIDDI